MRKLYGDFLKRLIPAAIILEGALCIGTTLVILLSSAFFDEAVQWNLLMGVNCVFPLTAGAVLTGTAFSFLHRRDASDMYLSFPCSRRGLFAAAIGAVLTWGAVILCGSILYGFLLLRANHAILLTKQYPALLFLLFTGFITVCGCFAGAHSLTGRRLYGFILGMVMLWLPRAVLLICRYFITAFSPVCELFGPFLGMEGAWATVTPFVIAADAYNPELFSAGNVLFNLLCAPAATAMACLLLCRRRGETAGLVAEKPILRHAITAFATFPLSFPFFAYCVGRNIFDTLPDAESALLCLGGALVVFCVLEIIPERKISDILRGLPHLLFSFLCGLAATGLAVACTYGVSRIELNGSGIKSVYVCSCNDYRISGYNVTDIPYLRAQISKRDVKSELGTILADNWNTACRGAAADKVTQVNAAGRWETETRMPLLGRVCIELYLNEEDTDTVTKTLNGMEGLPLFPADGDVLAVTDDGADEQLSAASIEQVYDLMKSSLTMEMLLDNTDYRLTTVAVDVREGLYVEQYRYVLPYACPAADRYQAMRTAKIWEGFRSAKEAGALGVVVLPERGGDYGALEPYLTYEDGSTVLLYENDEGKEISVGRDSLYELLCRMPPYAEGQKKEFRVIVSMGYFYDDEYTHTNPAGLCFACDEADVEELLLLLFGTEQTEADTVKM